MKFYGFGALHHQPFHGPMKMLGAEGSWDEKRNQLCIVACQILYSADLPRNAHVGDCSIRLSLRYPAFWSIQSRNSIFGQIWTNKTVNESGYFNRSTFEISVYCNQQSEKLMPNKEAFKRKEERHPKGNSYVMRKLGPDIQKSTGDPMDCNILLRFQFPPTNAKKGGFIKGSIESMREKVNSLYFGQLSASSFGSYGEEARKSIWRMDLEITVVVISNTLACVFVGLQLFYVKKNTQVLPFVSVVMLVILILGHAIPLVLNFEALFLGSRNRQNVLLRIGVWPEGNEVVVRVVTMVAFLLEFRLLQLAFSARLGDENQKGLSIAEKKAMLVSLPLYIVGVWSLMASFSLKSSSMYSEPLVKKLCVIHFILEPLVFACYHVYDLYRAHNYARNQFDGSYIYANPSADFYSTTWDVVISCWGVLFAVVIYSQQRVGGRFVVLQRLSEVEVCEMVNVESSE
ncbi:DUF2921 family protein, putative [Actinidia rufa]|uniref:RING-type E3 ubiquitin transferase n=1 Tax=Actinidia rufa TaxID=165716 RepID=A0A7J0GXB2_9ERIC|nr:DUF2921 family protein, putative [Actinidia rufa]